jgi:LPS sulfotransferase NodH
MKQNFLYSEQFDFSRIESKPKNIISLLFVPRSGSTLLSCLMEQTRQLGFPLEYFAKVNVEKLSERIPKFTLDHLDPLLGVRTSSNGVFSYKWNNTPTDHAGG